MTSNLSKENKKMSHERMDMLAREDKEESKQKKNPLPRAKSQPSDRLAKEQKTLACR